MEDLEKKNEELSIKLANAEYRVKRLEESIKEEQDKNDHTMNGSAFLVAAFFCYNYGRNEVHFSLSSEGLFNSDTLVMIIFMFISAWIFGAMFAALSTGITHLLNAIFDTDYNAIPLILETIILIFILLF